MQDTGRPINIRGTNFDGTAHWFHRAYLLLERDGLLITQTFAGTMVETERGPWESGFHTRGHYWADRWYNVIRLENPRDEASAAPIPEAFAGLGDASGGHTGQTEAESSLFGYYCNVATPVLFDGENLRYADLQLDVIVRPQDGRLIYEVRDEDEFDAAVKRYAYTPALIDSARAAVEEIVVLVKAGRFPFDR